MIKEIKENGFVQKCECGSENMIEYSTLTLTPNKIIRLPICPGCNSRIEFLNFGGAKDEYSLMIARIFMEVSLNHA